MKLHEKAKELGVKAKDLIKYLNDAGSDIRSPNQELSDIEVVDADNMISMPASKAFVATTSMLAVMLVSDKIVEIRRVQVDSDSNIVSSEILETKSFPSSAQAFAHSLYCINRIQMGVFNV